MKALNFHVVLVLRSLGSGGVESHVRRLAAGLKNRDYKVTIISLCDDVLDEQFTSLGIDIYQLSDSMGQSIKALNNIFLLRRLLLRLRPDAVHYHGIRPIFIGAIASIFSGVPKKVSTVHGSYELMAMNAVGEKSRAKLFVSKLMHSLGVMLLDKTIVVAAQLEKELKQCISTCFTPLLVSHYAKKITVIYNGIDDAFFELRDLCLEKEPSFCIGTIARLDPKKGVLNLLNAFKNLIANGYDCKLLIVGDGPCLSQYKKFANDAGLFDKVSFVGHQKNVIPFFEKMNVFVLPSLSEGMPLVILESMAMNVPVIATSVGGIPEIVKNHHTGLLVPASNTRSIEDAILVLMEDENLKLTMTANAKAYVEANHVESKMLEAVVALYKK